VSAVQKYTFTLQLRVISFS